LREAWKQTDQGGLPNHTLWKKFDAACTEAYATVQAWLDQLKQETAAQKSLRVQLIEEVKVWTAAQAGNTDWRAQARTVHQFSERWRNAGHLSEKAYAELQPQWKAAIHAAALPLEAAQKASHQRRQALIEEARALGAAPSLRIDAVKALQQRWQQEAQAVPLDRKTEQKLWETFRQPIDEAFQRKGTARTAHDAPLSARDKAVLDASKALDEANASGDVARIRSAMAALDAALKAQADQPAAAKAEAAKTEEPQPAPSESPAAEPASSDAAAGEASADPSSVTEVAQAGEAGEPSETAEAALTAPVTPVAPVTAPKPARPVVAVRGDDRPGQKKTEAQAAKSGRREGRPGERRDDRGPREGRREFGREGAGREGGRDAWRDEPRAPRLADAAFRAQRDARERAELALRKLAAQAHGETLVRVLSAWESRQAEALPSAQELGKAVSASARQAWAQALGQATASQAGPSLLRLEMAAEVPTPAEHLSERRALQLQLLTQRREAGPAQTWAHDVAQVLASAHDAASARRLQNALKQLLRR